MINHLLSTVTGIALWVWLVLAYGLWVGYKAIKPQSVSLVRTEAMPVIVWIVSFSTVVGVAVEAPALALIWLLAVATSASVGWFYLTAEPLEIDRTARTLVVPGTWTTLVLFLVIFTIKFAYGYTLAVAPEAAEALALPVAVFGPSGLATGVVTGRTERG